MGRTVDRIETSELEKAYKENQDFKDYVDKSKFPDLNIAFQNKMVKYYYLYLTEKTSC